MNHLVTGGAGFISHRAYALLTEGHRVCVLDDLSTGAVENVAHLRGKAGFTYVEGSATDAALVAERMDGVDAVFHLAAAVGQVLDAVRALVLLAASDGPTTSLDGILHSVISHHRAMHGRPRAATAAAP